MNDDTDKLMTTEAYRIRAVNDMYEALEGVLADIENLMSESEGVSGLHRNGDIAPWCELEEGGQFERFSWISKAQAALAKARGEA
jgi:hypothetical protein